MQSTTLFQTTPRILMGPGCFEKIAAEIERLGGRKAMLVTDPGIVAAGIASRLEALLSAASIEFFRFDKVSPDPNLETARAAGQALRDCDANLVIGLGGGSAIDIAKISAVLAANDGDLDSYFVRIHG